MTTLEREVLGLATDDIYGLWEALWLLRAKSPQTGDIELQNISKKIISNLLTSEAIYISRYDPQKGVEDVLPREEAFKEIGNVANWSPPAPGKSYIAFSSTESGDEVYHSG